MAGLKKKKKEKSTSPNVVLVIFLVLFVLVSIGLGVWGYYGYAEQAALRTARVGAEATAKSEKTSSIFHAMLWRDLRLAVFGKLEADEEELWKLDREGFVTDAGGGPYKDIKTKEVARKAMDDLRKTLDTGADGRSYKDNFINRLTDADAKIKELDAKLAAALAAKELAEATSKKLTANQDAFQQTASKNIADGNATALAEARKRTEEFKLVQANNDKLNAALKDKETEIGNIRDDHDRQLKFRDRKIKELEQEKRELAAAGAGGMPIAAGRSGDVFPLLLDISPGKPLWDFPVGKISRVDQEKRQVTINVGSAHGAQPEVSFNVFGANAAGRAEKQLKGTVEIVKVLDTSTSLARITSLYDSEVRDGDLLFNLFWGTRVAVTGYVSITGEPSDNPAEQIRQMEDFMYLLRRNGIQVDAYVDLSDGQVRGNISPKTRYLIRGDERTGESVKAAPKAAAADDDKDKEKEPAKDAPNAGRMEQIAKSNAKLRNDALDKGLLMISAENFATVIGYRKARNANNPDVQAFRPSLPYAGDIGAVRAAPPADRPPAEEKKAVDEKKEKDGGN